MLSKRSVAIISLLIFVVWILPLGVFIKPSAEKLACAGQRAICMCQHLLVKAQEAQAGEVVFAQGAGSPDKETQSSRHPFITGMDARAAAVTAFRLWKDDELHFFSFVSRSVEHVPKV